MTSVAYIPRYKNYTESYYGGVNYKSYQKYDYNRNVRETFPVRSGNNERQQNAFNTRNTQTYQTNYQPHQSYQTPHQPEPKAPPQTEQFRSRGLGLSSPASRGGVRGRAGSREITATKEFEDRATAILAEMRRQRRSMKLETACSVSSAVRSSGRKGGWRETINAVPSGQAEDQQDNGQAGHHRQSYLAQKRSSVSEFVGKVIRKLSLTKSEDQSEGEKPRLITNPLDFILMKEEYLKKNPPAPLEPKKPSEQPSGDQTMANMMDSLKKMVKKINPKREFPADKVESVKGEEPRVVGGKWQSERDQFEERMMKYRGANITPFNAHSTRWNSGNDQQQFRQRIQSKVLSSVHQATSKKIGDFFQSCDAISESELKSHNISPSQLTKEFLLPVQTITLVLESFQYTKSEFNFNDLIAHFNKQDKGKRKPCHAKVYIHGLNDPKSERFCYAVLTRSDAMWETVRPINVAVKKKTELFAPQLRGRASVTVVGLSVASITSPGTSGTTAPYSQERWEHLRGCALFSCVGRSSLVEHRAKVRRVLVVSLPAMVILRHEEDNRINQQNFSLCDRVPQSQLVQVNPHQSFFISNYIFFILESFIFPNVNNQPDQFPPPRQLPPPGGGHHSHQVSQDKEGSQQV